MSVLFFDLDDTLYSRSLGVVSRIDRRIDEYLAWRVGVPAADVVDHVVPDIFGIESVFCAA